MKAFTIGMYAAAVMIILVLLATAIGAAPQGTRDDPGRETHRTIEDIACYSGGVLIYKAQAHARVFPGRIVLRDAEGETLARIHGAACIVTPIDD